jgi:hypothetical protein
MAQVSTSEGSGGGGRSQWYGEQAQRYAETTSADVSEILPQSQPATTDDSPEPDQDQPDTKATRAEKVVTPPAEQAPDQETEAQEAAPLQAQDLEAQDQEAQDQEAQDQEAPVEDPQAEETAADETSAKATRAERVVTPDPRATRAEEIVIPETDETGETAPEEAAPEPPHDAETDTGTEEEAEPAPADEAREEPGAPETPPSHRTRLDLPVQRRPEPEPTPQEPARHAQEGPPPPFEEATPQGSATDEDDVWHYAPERPVDPWFSPSEPPAPAESPRPPAPPGSRAGAWSTPAEAAQDPSALADFFGSDDAYRQDDAYRPAEGYRPDDGYTPDGYGPGDPYRPEAAFGQEGGAQGHAQAMPLPFSLQQGQPYGPHQPPRPTTGIWHPRHLPVGAFVVAYGIAGTLNALFRWNDHKAEIANLLNKTIDSGAGSAGGILVAVHIVEVLLTLIAVAGLVRKRYVWYLPALVGWMAGFGVFVLLDIWAGDLGKLLEHLIYLGGFTILLFLSYALGVKARMNSRAQATGGDPAAGGPPLTRTQELALSALNNWRR